MTAQVEVEARAPAVRPTLAARLSRLAEHVRAVADGGGVDAGFASAVLAQLSPAVAAAAIQTDQSDQVAMLRAEAADRERMRDGLQSARRDLQNLVDLAGGLDAAVLSKSWLIERLENSIGRLGESLNPKTGSRKPGEFSTDEKED